MNITIYILTLFLTTLVLISIGQANSNYLAKYTTTETKEIAVNKIPQDFGIDYQNENNKLFVFVGEKIVVDELPHKEGSMDLGFKAKYKILQKVFGDFSNDTIEFVAYDHYGTPAFSKYTHVLLFVTGNNGKYYHQKYMYNDVYLTKNGKWAGSYAEQDYDHEYNKKTKVKPIKIEFATEVSYPTKIIWSDGQVATRNYPKKYFKLTGNKAIAVYGNYVEDLFTLKRDGYLTARKVFTNGKLND